MTPLKTRILIADDHGMVRRGLRATFGPEPDLEVVAEAEDGATAVKLALEGDVHLALLDVTMPRMTGLQAAHEITRRREDVRVLILSMHEDEQYCFEALKAGASGYVLKSAADRDLVEACRATMRGGAVPVPGGDRRADRGLPRALEPAGRGLRRTTHAAGARGGQASSRRPTRTRRSPRRS